VNILITGAAGNLGSNLARFLLDSPHQLRLMIHRRDMPFDVTPYPNASVYRADLGDPRTLHDPVKDVDCIVHFAGVLFAPRPEKFLQETNVEYVRNLVDAALEAGVRKFILISFPHVEGESFPDRPATGRPDGNPTSVHARTRLAAEKYLFKACEGREMVPVALRPGMIYARGILMIEAGRWLLSHGLLAVWKEPTWIHLLSLPDFLACVKSAIEGENISGIYTLGDDQPLTLQEFIDTVAEYWGYRRPWRAPKWLFYIAATCCETFAMVFRTKSPITRDFIKIGMASYTCDTSRMKAELLTELEFPRLRDGLVLL
jgi:nucleoside-diphosphate-sugar epimerase